jgi:hypothetical protein
LLSFRHRELFGSSLPDFTFGSPQHGLGILISVLLLQSVLQ